MPPLTLCKGSPDARRAQEGVGWTAPFWRECYVMSCIAAAVALASATTCDAPAALRHLDLGFIMGGQAAADVLEPFVALVEPLLARGDEPAAAMQELLPRTLPAAAAPQLQEGHELRSLEPASHALFRKEFYNVDAPVVLKGLAGARSRLLPLLSWHVHSLSYHSCACRRRLACA